MPANTYGRQVIESLTNKSGGAVIAGDVVIIDTTNNDAFTTNTTSAFTGMVGVAQEGIANNAVGRVATAGYVPLVNVNASVTRGNFGKTYTVAKQATDAGSSRVVGAFCQFLTGGTTPDAHLFGLPDGSSAAGSAFSGCSAYHSTTQTVGNSSPTVLVFDSETYDTDGYHSTVTNTGRLTIPSGKDGYFHIGGWFSYDTNATGQRQWYIRKNGSGVVGGPVRFVAAAQNLTGEVHCVVAAVAGDYFTLESYQDSGGTRTISSSDAVPTFFIARLGS